MQTSVRAVVDDSLQPQRTVNGRSNREHGDHRPILHVAHPRCPRYSSLDMWRGIACLSVIIYHATLYSALLRNSSASWYESPVELMGRLASYGHLGVPLFFVISGYCIAAAADAARRRPRPAGTYFWRRFRRIYPPLWAAMAVSVVFHAVVDWRLLPGVVSSGPWPQPGPESYSAWQWIGNVTLTETWRPHVVGGPSGHFPTQAWTLCYEEQFYAVMGILLLLAPRHLFGGAVTVTAFTAAGLVIARAADAQVVGWFFDGSWFTFAAGLLVYYVVNYRSRRAAVVASISLMLLVPVILASVGLDVVAGLSFASVLILLHPYDATISNAALARPVIWCGTMCYSLYLIHQPLVRGVASVLYGLGVTGLGATLGITVPLALLLSLIAGRTFYVAVERRFLNTSVRAARAGESAVRAPAAAPLDART